ncbi:hypothetical protein, partial [Streptomyces afghaniensis]|uniref:hypothetical protein n=1 Tax=Streptomyces afghaniensis TaxID=66865 RepID=UPI002469442C
ARAGCSPVPDGDRRAARDRAAPHRQGLRELARDCPDGLGARAAETALYCAVHRVHGVAPGWYRYLAGPHALLPVGAGADPDCARRVQEALF